ncbi:Oxoglutarate/iron-dependent dioxygenase - like 10 [Theobroma cacao]|uniref:procollagen-proline 4-dioxygenase n=1 Tax=Theobroma cacao TaxID=3641 RepID=A0AB32W631_THECC|nr:PREDICTED: probable prolyl 4-hydroxylase 12 isoform X1 [Theobroma cacao]WRX18096.1 Oxoglutarate/iron-dependent dioxygenase - like 10 [Theobroma cacao]
MALLHSIFLLLLFACSFSNISAESRKELRDEEVHEESVIQSRLSAQSNTIDPSRVMQLLWQPRVFLYNGFLSDEECDHLISLGHGAKEGILGINDDRVNVGTNRQLTSSEPLLNTEDKVLAMIEERISTWTFLPRDNGEPLQVRRHGLEGTEQNLDYFGNISTVALSEPLMATLILYLSNVTRGGEILFPHAEPRSKIWSDCAKSSNIVKPVKGNAILFFTTHLNASPDGSSSHARCPVLEGEMWFATKFFCLRAVKGDKVSFDSDGNECVDEDANCPQWAALGECQRNPVFMVGSPDYYGTCRKTCNAC